MTRNDDAVKELLGEALHGVQPEKRARDMVLGARPRRHRGASWLPAVAAVLVFGLVASSFAIPAVAWALAQTPLLGSTYAKFVEGTGLDLAYQAGLVKELNRTVAHGDFELLIVTAYRDANQTVVVHQLTSKDPALLAKEWESSHDLMPRFVFPRGWSGSSTMQYIEEENMIYGISHIDPDSWGIWGQKLTMQIPALDLTVTFPVQSVASSMSETVSVKKTVEYQGITIRVDDVVFSPSATRLNYTIINPGSQGASTILNRLNWALKAEDGTRIANLSGGLTNSRDGHVNFMPTYSRNLEILLTGETVFVTYRGTLPLVTGSSTDTGRGELTVSSLSSQTARTEVSLGWAGETRLGKAQMYLTDASGYRIAITSAELTATGMNVIFEHSALTEPLELEIESLLLEADLEVLVARVQR